MISIEKRILLKTMEAVDFIKLMGSQQDLKFAQLKVALESGNYEAIEKARFEVVTTYEACVDDYIRIHRDMNKLSQELKDSLK